MPLLLNVLKFLLPGYISLVWCAMAFVSQFVLLVLHKTLPDESGIAI